MIRGTAQTARDLTALLAHAAREQAA